MKQTKNSVLVLGAIIGLAATAMPTYARSCNGNEVIGNYGFVGSRPLFPGVAITPPGTAGTAALSTLIQNANSSSPFFTVGVLGFDNAGNVIASSTAGLLNTPVGTYQLNQDCSISVKLNDAFATSSASSTGATTAGQSAASASFEGVLLDGGNEIDLVQSGSLNPSTTQSGTVVTPTENAAAASPNAAETSPTGTTVILKRTVQFTGCTNTNLNGSFGLVGSGASGISGSPALLSLLGRMVSNGSGQIVLDPVGSSSPLVGLQLSGTYAVNSDCTGTATLSAPNNQSRTIQFVLVNSRPAATGGLQSGAAVEIDFVLSGSDVLGSGVAKQQ